MPSTTDQSPTSQTGKTKTGAKSVRLIGDIYKDRLRAGQPVVSIEFFPPKTPDGDARLFDHTLPALQRVTPDFYSVTYGAGGGTRDKTLEVVDRIQQEHQTTTMAHLTCISSSLAQIKHYLFKARQLGIRNILALRGDPPQDVSTSTDTSKSFEYAFQLVSFIKQLGGFSIGTAGFPESHVACDQGKHVDWQRLKVKIEAGADFVLTQLFFNNDDYFIFRDYLVNTLGVEVPITPGLLPIQSTNQIKRFTAICGATLPANLLAKLEKFGDDTTAVSEFGIEFASRQSEALIAGGAPGLHIYSLNKSDAASQIVKNLGLRA